MKPSSIPPFPPPQKPSAPTQPEPPQVPSPDPLKRPFADSDLQSAGPESPDQQRANSWIIAPQFEALD